MANADERAVSAALGGMIAMAVGIGIGRFVYTPILPPMLAALGLSKATAGLIASANFAGYLAGALGAARAPLAGPKRRWSLGALALSALTTGAMGFDGGLAWFLAMRFLGDAGRGCLGLGDDVADQRRRLGYWTGGCVVIPPRRVRPIDRVRGTRFDRTRSKADANNHRLRDVRLRLRHHRDLPGGDRANRGIAEEHDQQVGG